MKLMGQRRWAVAGAVALAQPEEQWEECGETPEGGYECRGGASGSGSVSGSGGVEGGGEADR